MKKRSVGFESADAALRSVDRQLSSEFMATKEIFEHGTVQGDVRESALFKFLEQSVPHRYGLTSGQVMDSRGRLSGQSDILIYDKLNTRPLFERDGASLLPAEALLAWVEVKSVLADAKISEAAKSLVKLHGLKPWDSAWTGRRTRGADAEDRLPRIFSTLFAYESSLATSNWPLNDADRVRRILADEKCPNSYLDRVVLLDRGIFMPAQGRAFTASEDYSCVGQWYFQLVSFLARETRRREAFPWDSYRIPYGMSSPLSPIDDAPAVHRATQSKRGWRKKARNRK